MSHGPLGRWAPRVLVVEDDLLTAASMIKYLQRFGYDARCAGDGPTALRLAQDGTPDVVLLDIQLEGTMDGCEVARRLRELPGGDRVLIVIISGTAVDEYRARACEAKVNLFFPKPADPELVLAILTQYQQRRERAATRPVTASARARPAPAPGRGPYTPLRA